MAVSKVEIGGRVVGIVDLEEIFEEVRASGLTKDEALKDAIFRKVQMNNYIPSRMESLYKEGLLEEYRIFTGEAQKRPRSSASPEIRLYGSSCFRCEKLDEMIKEILSHARIRADYQLVTDMREVAQAGVMMTPAIAVNGRMVLQGQVPLEADLEKMLVIALEGKGDA